MLQLRVALRKLSTTAKARQHTTHFAFSSTINCRSLSGSWAGLNWCSGQIASHYFLHRPTALLNKNTITSNNNLFLTKSNVVLSSNDRLALGAKLDEMVREVTPEDVQTGVLSRRILKAVSRGDPDVDAATMSKTSAVVAAKGDSSQLGPRINDLLDAVLTKQAEHESHDGRVTTLTSLIGTKDIVRQPSGVVNKNMVVSDSNVAIQHSDVTPRQNDQVTLSGGARVADTIASGSTIRVGEVQK